MACLLSGKCMSCSIHLPLLLLCADATRDFFEHAAVSFKGGRPTGQHSCHFVGLEATLPNL